MTGRPEVYPKLRHKRKKKVMKGRRRKKATKGQLHSGGRRASEVAVCLWEGCWDSVTH